MAKSQHSFQKRQREKDKQKKKQQKQEKREERKEKGPGLEIDWSSAPTEKTLTANNIDPDKVGDEEEDEGNKEKE